MKALHISLSILLSIFKVLLIILVGSVNLIITLVYIVSNKVTNLMEIILEGLMMMGRDYIRKHLL